MHPKSTQEPANAGWGSTPPTLVERAPLDRHPTIRSEVYQEDESFSGDSSDRIHPRRSSLDSVASRLALGESPRVSKLPRKSRGTRKLRLQRRTLTSKSGDGKRDEDEMTSVLSELAPKLTHISTNPAPEVGGDTKSGWTAVAESIRGIDEQKIKDYKEDIDSILTFAGLYSAVLSALLVESYQALQPDPSTIMITLLGQLVTQTHAYTLKNGYLNSTIPALDASAVSPPFEPSLAAKRVNVLWFASLTLSLISASFGILVKQWLREYLSGEYISPQAQLRIRHFRIPGLDVWRVFAIAALLPLILQLALALFFIGLCFFTLDIHHSIGYTTVPLVAGWAFLFVAASFAPVLSPQCPYKLAILKPVMTLLRVGLFRAIRLFKDSPSPQSQPEWITKPRWNWWSLGYSDEEASKEPCRDVDILVDLDASQTDAQLVMKMCSALKETHTRPELMIDFVLRIIASRLNTKFTRPLPLMLDLSLLPVQTCTILMDAMADVLAHEVNKFPESEQIHWTDLMRDCLFLLIARLPCLLSNKAMAVVSLCCAGTQKSRSEGTFELIFARVQPEERHKLCLHLQERLRNAFLNLNAWQVQFTIFVMMKNSCCTCGDCFTIQHAMDRHADTIPPVLRQHTCDALTQYMLHQVKLEAAWSEWHRDILLTLFKQWATNSVEAAAWHSALQELVRCLLVNPTFAPHIFYFLFHKDMYHTEAEEIFAVSFRSSTEEEQVLANMYSAFKIYLDNTMKIPELLSDIFYLTLLSYVDGQMSPMMYAVKNQPRSFVQRAYLPPWQMIWKMTHNALRLFEPSTRTMRHTALAYKCLEQIDILDDLWLPPTKTLADASDDFDKWVKAFNPAKSFFDDDIIEDLMSFLPLPEEVQYKRVRRIYRKRELERAEEAQIQETDNLGDGDEAETDDNDMGAAAADGAGDGTDFVSGEDLNIAQTDIQLAMKMCGTLKSMPDRPDLIIDLVLRIIAFSLKKDIIERPLPPMLDLCQLPVQMCNILMDTVADVLARELRKFPGSQPIRWTDLTRDCLYLAVARLPCPLSDKATAAVSQCLAGTSSLRTKKTLELMFASARPEQRYELCLHLQERLRNTFLHLASWPFLDTIFILTKESCPSSSSSDLTDLLERHAEDIPAPLIQHTCDVLAVYLLNQVKIGAAWGLGHRQILLTLLRQWASVERVSWQGASRKLIRLVLMKPKFAPGFYHLLFHERDYDSASEKVFSDWFSSSTTKQEILVSMYDAYTTYVVEMTKTPALLNEDFYLTLLWYIEGQISPMTYVVENETHEVVVALYLPLWQLILKTMHIAMSHFDQSKRTKDLAECASVCLEKIDRLDDLWLPPIQSQVGGGDDFDEWARAFNATKSFFEDHVIEDLMKFLPVPEKTLYKRVRRICRKPALVLLPHATVMQQVQKMAEETQDTRNAETNAALDA